MGNFLRPNKTRLQNPQHYELINAFLTVIADAGLSAAKITALVTQLTTAFQEEDRLYMQARASELIAQRDEADKRRDNFYARLHRLVQVWAGSGNTTMDPAATLLLRSFNLYKVKTSAQIEVESGQLSNLITDLQATDLQAALTTISGTYLFEQMKAAHEQVQSIRLAEGVEKSERVYGALVSARKACDQLYDQITYLIEAYALTADSPETYEAFITRWNGTLKIYQDMLDRKSGTPVTNNSGNGTGSGSGGTSQGSGGGNGSSTGGDSGSSGSGGSGGSNTGGGSGGTTGGGNTGGGNSGGGGDPVPGGDE